VRREPSDLQRERHIVADQVSDVASALGDFDQSTKLIFIRAGLNLKFYFNFLQMSFFIGPRMNGRPPQLDFAHARSDPE